MTERDKKEKELTLEELLGLGGYTDLQRLLRSEVFHALSCMRVHSGEEERVLRAAGLEPYTPSFARQVKAYAAAYVCDRFNIKPDAIYRIAGVSRSSVYNYLAKFCKPNKALTVCNVVKRNGRPRKYSVKVDAQFVLWLKSEDTPANMTVMPEMMKKYCDVCKQLGESVPSTDDRRLCQHIQRLYREVGYTMVTPKVVDAKRCAVYSTLQAWYRLPALQKSLGKILPALLFNADETQICRKGGAPGKVLKKKDFQRAT